MKLSDVIQNTEWGICSECGNDDFIPQVEDNIKCYDCLGIGFAKHDIYKKTPIPNKLRTAVFERDEYTCKMCGSREHLHADHIIPEIKGGLAVMENLQTLCRSCNSSKGAR